jgi:AraC-like DNA-binding protein
MLVARRFWPVHALLHTVVEHFQVVDTPPMTVARSIPNTRLDGWAVLEGSFEIDYDGSGRYRPAPAAGFSPMCDRPLWFRTVEGMRAVNFKCYPYLLGAVPFATLQARDEVVGFEGIFPKKAAAAFLKMLRSPATEAQKMEDLEVFLAKWLADGLQCPDDWLRSVMFNIGADPVGIERLAAASFVSVKTLERRFQRHTGLNPKSFCKLARFQQALKAIQQNPPESSAIPCLWDAGYYDQSHFIKDCRAITGLPPGRLFQFLPTSLTDIILLQSNSIVSPMR